MPLHYSGRLRIVLANDGARENPHAMIKFMILFRQPEDAEKFENVYQDFLALVERMPNILRRQVVHITGSPLGTPDFYRILELYFESVDTQLEALMSAAGQEAGKELSRLPSGTAELLFADVYEEEGSSTSDAVEADSEAESADEQATEDADESTDTETVSDPVSTSSAD